MTREHKLALIIGFSLVLLIGVLISDHFSRAGAMEIAGVSEGEGTVAPTVFPLTRDDLAPVLDRRQEANRAAESAVSSIEPAPLAADPPPAEAPPLGISLEDLRKRLEAEGWVTSGPEQPRQPQPRLEADPAPQPPPRTEPTPRTDPTPPAFADHTVKNGESLFQIAAKHLGDGNRWRDIRDANPRSVAPDGSVRAGVRLRIPLGGERTAIRDPAPPKVQEKPAAKPPAKAPAKTPSKTKPGNRARDYTTYTVRPGDSLGEIAARTLGTSKRMGEIAALNGLRDADSIHAGIVLKIPPG